MVDVHVSGDADNGPGSAGARGIGTSRRRPLPQADAIREAVTAMARATAQGWQVPPDLAIKARLHWQ